MSLSAPAPRANAVVYYVPEGYSSRGEQVMGINVASEGMLRGLALHGGVDALYALCEGPAAGATFAQVMAEWAPNLVADWISTGEIQRVGPLGTLMLPGPGLADYAWMRRRIGAAAFSLCGVTHTTATPRALDALTDLLTAPVEPWDAVICPSRSVRAMVDGVLDAQAEYLAARFGGGPPPRPQLPVIPLGIDATAFAPGPGEREAAREALGVAPGEVVLLFAGRLDPVTKSHPAPLFLAAAMAAAQARAPLRLLLSGWFASAAAETFYREAAAMLCPGVALTIVDGRVAETRRRAWTGADIFISPVDNIQETFGLTPVEAMAAGLPVIASDWDGYRDTVRHGVDGVLVRSWTPPGGQGADIARDYGARLIDYPAYVGVASQATAIDLAGLAQAIATLADDPEARARMGAAGRLRAADFDWSRIIPCYQGLWAELAERRALASRAAGPHPARPDPFTAFASYPTAAMGPDTRVGAGLTAPGMIEVLLASPLIAFAAGALPGAGVLAALVGAVEGGPTTAGALASAAASRGVGPNRLWRALGWLAKYGFLRLEP